MGPVAGATVSGLGRLWSRTESWRPVVLVVAALSMVLVVLLLREQIRDIDWTVLGYPGVFLLSLVGSVAMVLPVPGLASLCAVSLALNPLALGLLAGLGETIGELSGYAVGYGGKGALDKSRMYIKVQEWMHRRGLLLLFLVSIVPNPLFDVVGIAAGATRLPLIRFLATVWLGKSIKGVGIAYACSRGMELLPWFQ